MEGKNLEPKKLFPKSGNLTDGKNMRNVYAALLFEGGETKSGNEPNKFEKIFWGSRN